MDPVEQHSLATRPPDPLHDDVEGRSGNSTNNALIRGSTASTIDPFAARW
jgi:hypothetical protein